MKIYTKTGDQGDTGLLGGVRVSKSHLAIKVCGAIDETNSFLGLVRSETLPGDIDGALTQIQHHLFDLGSQVAACLTGSDRVADFPASRVAELERLIDRFELELNPLTAFILPSGNRAGCTLHLARAVCRRGERELVELMATVLETPLDTELVYLNRLGDLLFVLARVANARAGCSETEWNVAGKQNPPSEA